MKMLYRSALAVALVVSFAAASQAQAPPQSPPASPPPIQDPYPGRTVQGPEGLASEPPVRDEPWSLSLSANGSYEGNALFTGPSDTKEFSHALQASIGRAWKLRRGDAQLGGTASQAFYQDTTSLNDFRYSIFGGLGHAITRRLNWSGSVSLSSGLARDSQVLTDAGVVLPSTTTARTSTGSSAFSYALSPASNLTWSLSTSGVGFSSAAFNGGTGLTTAVNYNRSVGASQSVGATADYVRTFSEDSASNVYGLLGLWTFTARRGWMVSASGGVKPYDVPGEPGLRTAFAMSAGVTKPVRRNQVVGVAYSRSIERAFGAGVGNSLVHAVTASYALPLHRNVSASFGGSFTKSRDPLAPPGSWISGEVAQAALTYQALRNLSIGVSSS